MQKFKAFNKWPQAKQEWMRKQIERYWPKLLGLRFEQGKQTVVHLWKDWKDSTTMHNVCLYDGNKMYYK